MGLTDNVQSIYGAFSDIKDAIEDKGVTVAADTPVTEYADLIGDIPSGGTGGLQTNVMLSQVTDTTHTVTITPTDTTVSAIEQRNDMLRQVVDLITTLDSTLTVTETTFESGYKQYTLCHSGANNVLRINANAWNSKIVLEIRMATADGTVFDSFWFTAREANSLSVRYQSYNGDFYITMHDDSNSWYTICGMGAYNSGSGKAWMKEHSTKGTLDIMSENTDIPYRNIPYDTFYSLSNYELWNYVILPNYQFDNFYWYKHPSLTMGTMLSQTLSDGTKNYGAIAYRSTNAGRYGMLVRAS